MTSRKGLTAKKTTASTQDYRYHNSYFEPRAEYKQHKQPDATFLNLQLKSTFNSVTIIITKAGRAGCSYSPTYLCTDPPPFCLTGEVRGSPLSGSHTDSGSLFLLCQSGDARLAAVMQHLLFFLLEHDRTRRCLLLRSSKQSAANDDSIKGAHLSCSRSIRPVSRAKHFLGGRASDFSTLLRPITTWLLQGT